MDEASEKHGFTRRELIKKGALVGGTVLWVTPVIQTVGMQRALAQEPSDTCEEQWAAEVVSEQQGQRKDTTEVLVARSNPNNALGAPTHPPENSGEEAFYSLGFGGTLVLKFANRAYIHTGSDVVVVETTGGTYPLEEAEVEVSPDGSSSSWYSIGTADNSPSTTTLDMSGVPYDYIQYVKLTDTTDDSPFGGDADGFDVNAVGIVCGGAAAVN